MLLTKWMRRAQVFRRVVNFWPPLMGAGIKIEKISNDWLYAKTTLSLNRLNRNLVGTQYGGSIFSMTDMMYMILLMHHIGDHHRVWDSAATIRFLKPGRNALSAEFQLDQNRIDAIVKEASDSEKHFQTFTVDVRDQQGELIASVDRTLYIRRKRK